MMQLLIPSGRAVATRAIAGPLLAGGALNGLLVTIDPGYVIQLLRGIGVLLALAVALAVDDPCGPVLAASPYSVMRRMLCRIAAATIAVTGLWTVAVSVVAVRQPRLPIAGLTLEALTWWAVALTLAVVMGRASGSFSPSYVAGPVLLAIAMVVNTLPRGWTLMQVQTWGHRGWQRSCAGGRCWCVPSRWPR